MAAHVAAHLTAEHFAAWAVSPDHELLVAVAEDPEGDDGRLLGYALLARGATDDPDVAAVIGPDVDVELSKIYVHPDAQGSGLAGDLMREALDAARDLSAAPAVWLGTNGENARAQAFYRKHGFVLVGNRTYVVGGESHDDVVMVCPLR